MFLGQVLKNIARYPVNRVRRIFTNPAIILAYHRIASLSSDVQRLAVGLENFYEQMQFLKRNYRLLTAEEFVYYKNETKKFPRGCVLVTVDDGYADNYLDALPILEAVGGQAIFYVSTANVDSDKELWWDELERLLLSGQFPSSLSIAYNGEQLDLDTSDRVQCWQSYELLHQLIKNSRPDVREVIMGQLIEKSGKAVEGRMTHRVLTSEEIANMAESKAAVIGAHTHSHTLLRLLKYEEQYEDIKRSKEFLEKCIGKNVNHFSYPFGAKKDYNQDSVNIVQALGFDMVCSNYHNQVYPSTSIYELPRILVRDWHLGKFRTGIRHFFNY